MNETLDAWAATDRELFELATGLQQLRDPVLFRLLVQCRESFESRNGIDPAGRPTPYARFKQALPEVIGVDEWAQRFEPAITRAMAEAMPQELPDRQALAQSALGAFREAFAKKTLARMLALAIFIFTSEAEMGPVHKAAKGLREAFAGLGVNAFVVLFQHVQDRGGSLPDFNAVLDTLIEVTEPLDAGGPQKQGQRPAFMKQAVVTTGDYLVRKGLKRQRAARVLAALMAAHPDLPGGAEEGIDKATKNYEQVLRNAGVG